MSLFDITGGVGGKWPFDCTRNHKTESVRLANTQEKTETGDSELNRIKLQFPYIVLAQYEQYYCA